MENALLIGLSRQMVLQREMEVVANNIANVDTNGFKADFSQFEEFLSSAARAKGEGAGGRVSYVHSRGTLIDLTQGSVQRTGNPLDVALNGEGFIVIQTPRGERYTRNGSLQINSQGELVTSEGYQVQGDAGPIQLQTQDTGITINPEGTVSVHDASNASLEIIRGRLRLVGFDRAQRLEKDGSSSFAAPAGMQPNPNTNVRVMQGALEKSNVQPVLEMSHMIEVSRAYSMISSLIQSGGDLRKSAIQQLADVPTS